METKYLRGTCTYLRRYRNVIRRRQFTRKMSRRHLHLPLRHSTARKRIPNYFWLLDIRTKSGSSRSHRNRRETVEVTSRPLLRAIYSRKKLMRIRYAQTPHSRVWSRHYIFFNKESMRWASQDDIFTPAWGVTSKKYSVFIPTEKWVRRGHILRDRHGRQAICRRFGSEVTGPLSSPWGS